MIIWLCDWEYIFFGLQKLIINSCKMSITQMDKALGLYLKSLRIIYLNNTYDDYEIKWDDFIANQRGIKIRKKYVTILKTLINEIIDLVVISNNSDNISLLCEDSQVLFRYLHILGNGEDLYEDWNFNCNNGNHFRDEYYNRLVFRSETKKKTCVLFIDALCKNITRATLTLDNGCGLISEKDLIQYLKLLNIGCEYRGLTLFDVDESKYY